MLPLPPFPYTHTPCAPQPAMSDDSKMKCSVRSIGESEDTTEISEAYGGGGHRNASSFITDAAVFERWRQA